MQQQELPFEIRDMRHKEKFEIDDFYLNGFAKKCGIYATGVYISLCRHANKEQQCWPSIKKIAEELNISEKQVSRSLAILEKNKIIFKKRMGKKLNNRYVLLDKSEWTGSPFTTDSQSDHLRTDSPIHSKESQLRTTHSKEAIPSIAGKEINSLIEKFKPINPFYERLFANTTQRGALERLFKKMGRDKLEEILAILPKINKTPYAPTITTPFQLENKLGDLIAFIQKERSKLPTITKINKDGTIN